MMKTHLYTILIIFTSCFTYSQTAKEYSEMAESKVANNDYQYALILIDKAIALNDTNEWYPIQKSEIEFKLYGPRDAINTILKAIKLNRKKSEFYNRAGSYYESGGLIDSAVYMFNLAIKYAPNDTLKYAYFQNRGAAKIGNRNFEGAKQDFEKVLEFNPNDIATLNNIANVYDELGEKNKAILTLKKIITIEPNFIGTYVNLGFCYTAMDSIDLAINYFNHALKLDPKEAVVYNNRGYAYYKLKDYASALKDVNYSISLYPTNSYAYRNLALIYIDTKKIHEACDALNYAKYYGFEQQYGEEVNELLKKYCK